jgi:hypothetical protein
MNGRSDAVLQATGEKLVLLHSSASTNGRHLCLLPPQQPWHRPRIQEIRSERLQFPHTR